MKEPSKKKLTTDFQLLRFIAYFPQIVSKTITYIARHQWLSVTLVAVLGFTGSAAVGLIVGTAAPHVHDEFSHLLAADTFAHGRLTNPTHPMWVHFESFHIIHRPTYMSKYPPTQGLVLAAGQLIASQPIVGVWISFGLMCAATTWMLFGWVPARWAVLGGVLAVINPVLGITGYWAQSYWGGAAAASGGALVLGGTRRLMRQPHVYDALLLSLGLTILANSRPFEGLLVSLPLGFILLDWMISKQGPSLAVSVKHILMPVAVVLVLTCTGMALYNLRVTGDALRLPYQVHERTYGIAPLFLWQQPAPEPEFRHQVIRDFHVTYELSLYNNHRSIVGFVEKLLLTLLLLIFYPLNILAAPMIGMFTVLATWTSKNRWAQRAVLIYLVLILGLSMETFARVHYAAPIASLNYFFVVTAMRFRRLRNKKVGQSVVWRVLLFASLSLVISLYGALQETKSSTWYMRRAQLLKQLKKETGEHLIIVGYGPEHSVHDEWVYNEADIDAAKVVWARRMNRIQDCELVKYFRRRRIWSLDADQLIPELKPYPTNQCE